jgi:alpha/beta hydrolase fold
MRRREFLKNAASTVIAGSLAATAARADEETIGEVRMSKVQANGITINYEQQGTGEPLVLIPYLAADHACYAFQVADYANHFTCISLDPRGAGETDKPDGNYSMELFADDIAAFMQAIGVERAHVSGLSLGAARDYGLPANIHSESSHCRCTAAGPRLIHSSRPLWEVDKAPPRA